MTADELRAIEARFNARAEQPFVFLDHVGEDAIALLAEVRRLQEAHDAERLRAASFEDLAAHADGKQREAEAEIKRLTAGTWQCTECGARYPDTHPELLEGETRCSHCVQLSMANMETESLNAEITRLRGLLAEVPGMMRDAFNLGRNPRGAVLHTDHELVESRIAAFMARAEESNDGK